MESFQIADGGSEPCMTSDLAESFIVAVSATLKEMAGTDVGVQIRGAGGSPAYKTGEPAVPRSLIACDIVVIVDLASELLRSLVVSFPATTASGLAERILAGVADVVDDSLVRDCAGEIANVVAGQAKAMLAHTPYHFAFSVPRVLTDTTDFAAQDSLDCLSIALHCDLGDFVVQVFLKIP